MRKLTMVVALAAVLMSAQGALAYEKGGNGGDDQSRRGPGRMLRELDKDGDGSISKAEFMAGSEARFARMDKNSDGVLSKDDRPERPSRDGAGRGDDDGKPQDGPPLRQRGDGPPED